MAHFKIFWHDAKREPQCQPNPAYPKGVDVDRSDGARVTCWTTLPYPALRCGPFLVECAICGMQVRVSTAGRPDDPRSLTVACKPFAAA